jgi:type II secretory pathway component PulM
MKRFQFPLDRVRRWRSEQASLEELKLQQLRAESARLTSARREVEAEGKRSAQEVLSQPTLDPLQLTSLESYGLHLRRRVYELLNRERQAEAKVGEQRQRVIEARRKFELLDNLHQKAWQEWIAASNKEQEDLASEMFLAQTVRKRSAR